MFKLSEWPIRRQHAYTPAQPLDPHVIDSIAFLKHIDTIQLTGGDKQTFDFMIQLHPLDGSSEPSTFTIQRTAQEIDLISKIVQDAYSQHVDLDQRYHVPSCRLCEPFKHKVKLPVHTSQRLVLSTEKIHQIMEEHVVALVRGAIVRPTIDKIFCEGVTRFPPALTKFILKGVDQTKF